MKPQLFHCLHYTDANKGIAFLTAIGFTERLVVRDPDDSTVVFHAQLGWRDNGGVMLGSDRPEDPRPQFRPGHGVCNLVVESDAAVDETVRKAVDAGAQLVDGPTEPPHGGRTAGVVDFDGNYWNIDSYPGE